MNVFIFVVTPSKIMYSCNNMTLTSVKFIPIHRFMKKIMRVKNLVILLSCVVLIASCKGKGLFKKKSAQSEVTGWNYNDKKMGGYQVAKTKEQGL